MNQKADEFEAFNRAMESVLNADPKAVKQEMEDEMRHRAEARKAKRASLASDRDPDDPA